MILLQDCSSHLDSSKNIAARWVGLFSPYIYIENFKNLLVRNHSTDFSIILQKCSFGYPLPRLFKSFQIRQKTWLPGGAGLIFPIYLSRKFKKSSYQKPLERLQYNVAEMFLLVILYQDSSSHLDSSKNMAARRRGLFSLYIYIEKLEKSSCQKPLDRFHYNLAKMFPW